MESRNKYSRGLESIAAKNYRDQPNYKQESVTGRRFYDPAKGRFLSRDKWFGNLGEPQTYHRYLYAVDNPIRYRDASGMSPTESALLVNPFKEETKEYSFPLSLDQAVAETTSGIRKGRITEPLYQETGLDWLEKSVDWLMDTSYGDALSYSFFLMNPSFVASSYIKGMLIDEKSGDEVTQEFMEHSRGFHGSFIKAIPKQLYDIVTFPDMVKAELEEITDISHCTNQTGFSRAFYTGNEYLNRKLDRIGNGIKGTINAYLNGDEKTKGEIEGKLLFGIAEIAATRPMVNIPMGNKAMVSQPMVNKPVKLDGVDDKQIKQTIEERKQADIEELCLLLSYEKDLTGNEKIHRDTIINRIFEEGDIPKMRAVAEKLSKKQISKWTQSERSFNEQVLRYGAEKEKTELDTIEETGNVFITKDLLNSIGYSEPRLTDSFMVDLNNTLDKFIIAGSTDEEKNKERIAKFLAQISVETGYGKAIIEQGNIEYFNNTYGSVGTKESKMGDIVNEKTGLCRYCGAGYIQLSTRSNYAAFAKAIDDPEVLNQGVLYVAENYAWLSTGWWWQSNGMNKFIDDGATIAQVSKRVNGGTNGLKERTSVYNKIREYLN